MNVDSGCIPDIEVVFVFMLSDQPGCEVLILSKTSTFHGSFYEEKIVYELEEKRIHIRKLYFLLYFYNFYNDV